MMLALSRGAGTWRSEVPAGLRAAVIPRAGLELLPQLKRFARVDDRPQKPRITVGTAVRLCVQA